MVRLKDVAERAGVSIMTVSKAMRGASDISAVTRERVRALAQQMGYVPDTVAQGLRNGKTGFLGLVISTITDPVFARTIVAIEDQAHQLGYDLILAHTLNDVRREERCIRRLLARKVDGLFIFPVYRLSPHAPVYEEVAKRKVPTVILGHTTDFCRSFPSVETDDAGASYRATQYLLSLGHRKIAYFAGPVASPAARERLDAYRRAMFEAQTQPDEGLVFNAGNTIEDGEKATLQMLNESCPATAIQTFNDMVAIGAGNTLLNQGIKIPEHMSLMGFGNILISEYFRVPLTTVRQPKFRLGTAAFECMRKLLQGTTGESKRLPAEVIVRASTAPR